MIRKSSGNHVIQVKHVWVFLPTDGIGTLVGCSWALLGRSWDDLERSWALLGLSWDALGTLLGRSWALLIRSWGALARFLTPLADLESNLEHPRVDFGASRCRFWFLCCQINGEIRNCQNLAECNESDVKIAKTIAVAMSMTWKAKRHRRWISTGEI